MNFGVEKMSFILNAISSFGYAKFEPSIYFKCVRTSYNVRH